MLTGVVTALDGHVEVVVVVAAEVVVGTDALEHIDELVVLDVAEGVKVVVLSGVVVDDEVTADGKVEVDTVAAVVKVEVVGMDVGVGEVGLKVAETVQRGARLMHSSGS